MSKILIVTEGSYSDYRILAVFSEEYRGAAEAIAGEWGTVEEWELNKNVDGWSRGLKLYDTAMLGNGNKASAAVTWEAGGFRSFENRDGRWVADTVWAKDETHAIKIVNERRTVWLATGMWPEASDDS